jgi:predicted 3-demethylubiquinone-9 3-methyltransferase (glyoxalase superfamily)
MRKVRTFLWFDDNAELAANFYVSLFRNSSVVSASPMMVTFVLDGQEFMALNGGPSHALSPAVSLFVDCEDQAEVDDLWAKLIEDGKPSRCGWLVDRFGLSWQIIPKRLGELMNDDDDEKSERVLQAMLGMVKIDVAALERAYEDS